MIDLIISRTLEMWAFFQKAGHTVTTEKQTGGNILVATW